MTIFCSVCICNLFWDWPILMNDNTNRWVVRNGSVSATAATSCATPPPPSSPPSPPSPQSSHPSSSSSPFPSPSPPLPPSYPSTSLWPISRQIWLLLPQGLNSARELYHNYFAFRTTHVTVGVSHRNKDFLQFSEWLQFFHSWTSHFFFSLINVEQVIANGAPLYVHLHHQAICKR